MSPPIKSFAKLPLSQWQIFRQWEADEAGYTLVLVRDGKTALYFNGVYFCYARTYDEESDQ